MIYLDNNATTQIDPEVLEAMLPFLTEAYGNPSSAYTFGKRSRRAVDTAREQVAALIGAEPGEIVFTGCGTESINTALHSALRCYPERRRILTTTVEHSATNKTCADLEKQGVETSKGPVDSEGRLRLDEFRPDANTALVSVILANNETGVLSPIAEAAAAADEAGVLFHTDAVQAVGKIPVSVKSAPIHLLSISGHKLHAPKGVGVLFVSRHVRFHPFLFGGGQENERRSGTENVASIVGLGKAAEIAGREDRTRQLLALRDRFEAQLRAKLSDIEVNGDADHRLPNTSNLHFPGIEAQALLVLLDNAGVCASPGSACSTGSTHGSAVLTAMGFSERRAKGSLRFSVSRFTTPAEIDEACESVVRAVERVRSVMPAVGGAVVQFSGAS